MLCAVLLRVIAAVLVACGGGASLLCSLRLPAGCSPAEACCCLCWLGLAVLAVAAVALLLPLRLLAVAAGPVLPLSLGWQWTCACLWLHGGLAAVQSP